MKLSNQSGLKGSRSCPSLMVQTSVDVHFLKEGTGTVCVGRLGLSDIAILWWFNLQSLTFNMFPCSYPTVLIFPFSRVCLLSCNGQLLLP